MPPEEEEGGNLKYLIIGILLLGGVVGIWAAMSGGDDPEPVTEADTGPPVERSTSLAEPIIELPDPEPDAAVEDTGPTKTKIVYRYVRDDWDCPGDIDASAAMQVVRGYNRQIRNCYERQLKTNHTLQGNMRVMVRVGSNGHVTGTRVNGSLRSPPVFACVRNLANNWQFPNPTGGCAVVSVPFNFSPRE
jgi:hypothetical protein